MMSTRTISPALVTQKKGVASEDLDHDILWRYLKCLPQRGRIGIFNRSYYEEVLVVRLHPEILARQKLPQGSVGKRIWDERLADIAKVEDVGAMATLTPPLRAFKPQPGGANAPPG